ncbi:MAG: NAD(P)H-dependent oxidoreductase [Planctomycetota bacterium]
MTAFHHPSERAVIIMVLIISSSLHPESRSRIMAIEAVERLQRLGRETQLLDLSKNTLPPCDGASAYGDPAAQQAVEMVSSADAILCASPIYNYDVNASLKNLVELTGRAWTGKVVGMMVAAGGAGSYMAPMGLANSLMLDFRCLILPRFVYATGDKFEGDHLADETVSTRIDQLLGDLICIADALKNNEPKS